MTKPTFSIERSEVRLLDEAISYKDERMTSPLLIPLEKIKVVGELVTHLGPDFDDQFLCLALDENWYSIPTSSVGFNEFREALSDRLSHPINLSLGAITTLDSRIIWPKELIDFPMFDFETSIFGFRVEYRYTLEADKAIFG